MGRILTQLVAASWDQSIKLDHMKLHRALLAVYKTKHNKKYLEEQPETNEDAVAEHEEACYVVEIEPALERAEKKFANQNEKLAKLLMARAFFARVCAQSRMSIDEFA